MLFYWFIKEPTLSSAILCINQALKKFSRLNETANMHSVCASVCQRIISTCIGGCSLGQIIIMSPDGDFCLAGFKSALEIGEHRKRSRAPENIFRAKLKNQRCPQNALLKAEYITWSIESESTSDLLVVSGIFSFCVYWMPASRRGGGRWE